MNKRAQEEMVGFAMIIIIVSVILLVFLGFSLRDSERESLESYEVQSFIQSSLQYSTDCRDRTNEIQTVQDLILECENLDKCSDGRDTCEVLESVLRGISDESWKTGENRPIKGYELNITSENKRILVIQKGNLTNTLKGDSQPLSRGIEYIFRVYY